MPWGYFSTPPEDISPCKRQPVDVCTKYTRQEVGVKPFRFTMLSIWRGRKPENARSSLFIGCVEDPGGRVKGWVW